MSELKYKDLRADINEASEQFPPQQDDQKFTYWFLKAYITEDDNAAKNAVCGGPKDRGIDGIFIDESAQTVYLIQSKYRKSINVKNETDSEINKFTDTINNIFSPDWGVSRKFFQEMESATASLARDARDRVLRRNFSTKFIYVTTGRRPFIYIDFAKKRIKKDSRSLNINATFLFLGGTDVIKLLRDYRDGVAPPIPEVGLEIEKNSNISSNNIYKRYDKENDIRAWMITMSGDKVADLFRKYGVRIFARNIRGYLGMSAKSINKKVENTLKREPDKFYYYNNGITMICDSAEEGGHMLTVGNPQIINGQQTTRVLASASRAKSSKVGVTVKIVQVPRISEADNKSFDQMVSKIVDGTNRQNAISQSDLISNHRVQIELHRNLKPLGYIYLRKKMSRTEAKRIWGNFGKIFISKDDFARASAATQFDQHVVRSGVNHLYENHIYEKVFPSSDPLFYLPKYFVMRLVKSASKGKPGWGYSKWMITGFIWDEIRDSLRSNARKKAFINAVGERNSQLHSSLEKLCVIAMRGAADFYRISAGKGASKLDVSQFYRNQKGRNVEFEKFWNSRLKKRKSVFRKELDKFRGILIEL